MADIVSIGEILWDVFPDRLLLGGATYNFSVHAATLGHRVHFLSAVGEDELGAKAFATASQFGLKPQVTSKAPTGQVTVQVGDQGQPTFTLHRPAAYDFVEWVPPSIAPDWIYFGTLHQIYQQPKQVTRQLLNAYPTAPRFYDVNLRKDCYSPELLMELLPLADVLKLNDAEVRELCSMFHEPNTSLELFCRRWSKRFDWETVCVTRGALGCALFREDEYLEVAGVPVEVADTVGAGDAFSAALVHGLSQDWPLQRIGEFANRVGALVAGRHGGTPNWSPSEISKAIS